MASSVANSATRSRAVIHGMSGDAEPEPGGEGVEQGERLLAPELHGAQRPAELRRPRSRGRACAIRSRCRASSDAQTAALKPKVIGSPGWPWVRPHITVSRCSPRQLERGRLAAGDVAVDDVEHRPHDQREPGVGDVLHGGAVVDPLARVAAGSSAAQAADQPERGVPGRAGAARRPPPGRAARRARAPRIAAAASAGTSPSSAWAVGQRGEDVQPGLGAAVVVEERVQLRGGPQVPVDDGVGGMRSPFGVWPGTAGASAAPRGPRPGWRPTARRPCRRPPRARVRSGSTW